jgi:ComF family protein
MFKNIFRGILDFIIPPLCISCEAPLEKENSFTCTGCSKKLVRYESEHPWKNAYILNGTIDNSFSLYQFIADTPVQHLLHSLKYEKMKSIGIKLGKEIAENMPKTSKIDLAVPVPLHFAKLRERTYNQSDYICRGIGSNRKIDTIPKLLKRNRFTKSQTKLDKYARQENVRSAFELNPKYKEVIQGKNIILVDDVITTGATILECARVLKESGAAYVIVCSAAYDALD